MTPQEKAFELVGEMYQSAEWLPEEDYDPQQQYKRVKKYALIAADAIISIAPNEKSIVGTQYLTMKEFWRQVKSEIEKM